MQLATILVQYRINVFFSAYDYLLANNYFMKRHILIMS
jgi:hypothetical protein